MEDLKTICIPKALLNRKVLQRLLMRRWNEHCSAGSSRVTHCHGGLVKASAWLPSCHNLQYPLVGWFFHVRSLILGCSEQAESQHNHSSCLCLTHVQISKRPCSGSGVTAYNLWMPKAFRSTNRLAANVGYLFCSLQSSAPRQSVSKRMNRKESWWVSSPAHLTPNRFPSNKSFQLFLWMAELYCRRDQLMNSLKASCNQCATTQQASAAEK